MACTFSGDSGDLASGHCCRVEAPMSCISNSLPLSIFSVNCLFLASCSPARVYRPISELSGLLREVKSFALKLTSGWSSQALSSSGFWWRTQDGGRKEVFVVGLCAAKEDRGAFSMAGSEELRGARPVLVTATSVLGKVLISASCAENPVSSFSLPFSPLTILPGTAPLQTPAAQRPAHLPGRETRFVSACQCAVCAAAPCCSRPAPLPFAPSSISASPAPGLGAH